jgi:hypothetical protein
MRLRRGLVGRGLERCGSLDFYRNTGSFIIEDRIVVMLDPELSELLRET